MRKYYVWYKEWLRDTVPTLAYSISNNKEWEEVMAMYKEYPYEEPYGTLWSVVKEVTRDQVQEAIDSGMLIEIDHDTAKALAKDFLESKK